MNKLTGFAEACYTTNTRTELEYAAGFPAGIADEEDCAEWKLSASEWHAAIGQALSAKRADYAAAIAATPGTPELVWTSVDSLEQLGAAEWKPCIIESHSEAKTWVAGDFGWERIKVMGVRIDGVVTIEYARSDYSSEGWSRVSPWHIKLAEYFIAKYNARPASDALRPFFDAIDAPGLAGLVRFSLTAHAAAHEDSRQGNDGIAGNAARTITEKLRALGVPCGDWVYVPLLGTLNNTRP